MSVLPLKIIEGGCITMKWRPQMIRQMAHTLSISLADCGIKNVIMGVVVFTYQVQQALPKRNDLLQYDCLSVPLCKLNSNVENNL